MRVSFQAITLIILIGTVLVLAVSEVPQLSPSFGSQTKIHSSVTEQFKLSQEIPVLINVRELNGAVPKDSRTINKVKKVVPQGKILSTFGYDAFIASLTQQQVAQLAKSSSVHSIVYETEVPAQAMQDVIQIVDAQDTWGLEVEDIGLTGQGQTICIIDSGINFLHPDLQHADILGYTLDCFATPNCIPDSGYVDLTGHGTYVAGVAAANGQIKGIAKDADLIGARVFTESGTTVASRVRRAIDWCVANSDAYGISVISMSISSTNLSSTACDTVTFPSGWSNPLLAAGVADAVAQNIAVVAGSGNNGNPTSIGSPACLSQVISVGATTKTDTLWSSSNYNSLVKLFAPGENIKSSWPEGMWPDGSPGDVLDGYWISSGTSASTPVVAGTIAIMNQYLTLAGESMSMNPKTEIEPLLFAHADPILDLPSTWKRINIFNTIIMGMDSIAPTVNLQTPTDEYLFDETADLLTSNYQFECSATDWSLNQIELELYYDGLLMDVGIEPEQITGDSDTHTFVVPASVFSSYLDETADPEISPSQDYIEKTFEWNCMATDSNDNSGEAAQDYSFSIKKLIIESA